MAGWRGAAGRAGAKRSTAETTRWRRWNRSCSILRAIFVHPEFARQGLGSAILALAERAALAEGFRRFEMGSTLTGVALYRLKGYREVEHIEVPVGAGETISVVRMMKEAD
jgi:GNAT superfamily N-acetyltransferase